jgi:hypothetical protein
MEAQDIMKTKIGTKETSKLKPSRVRILGVEIQTKTKDGSVMKTPLANILIKHPDREEQVKVSKIKCERNGKLEIVSLWCQLDEDKQFQKSSGVSELLRFLKIETLNDLTGKEIEAVEQSKEDTYLCLKVY